MKKGYNVLIFIFLSLQFAFAGNPFIKNYTIENGLPTNKIIHVYQDSKDFIWFSTDAGVTRFDGHNFVNFTLSDGLSDNVVMRIKEDSSGRIWFFNLNGTVNYYFESTVFNALSAPFLNDLKTNFFIFDFYEDSDSTLYFFNSISEIFTVKNNQLIDYNNFGFDNIQDIGLYNFGKTPDNEFLLWTARGIYKLNDLDEEPELQTIPQEIFLKAFSVGESRYLVLDRSGNIHLYENERVVQKNITHSETPYINSVAIDEKDNIWLATYDNGVFCFNNNELVLHLDIKQAQGINIDKQQNIWITSSSQGIYKIDPELNNYHFIDKSEFNNLGIRDIEPARNGGIWITNGESIQLIYNHKLINKKIDLNGKILDKIYQLSNNTIITNSSGAEAFIIENVKYNHSKNSIEFGEILKLNYTLKNITVNKAETYLYSYINNDLIITYLNDFSRYETVQYKTDGRISNILYNRKNLMVINSDKNYFAINNSLRANDELTPFNGLSITSHLIIDDQNEIYNLIGNQLVLMTDSGYFDLTKEFRPLIDYRIRDMVYDGSTLFFFTSKTVFFISNPLNIKLGEKPVLNRLNAEFNDINDVLVHDSILYIATSDGLNSISVRDFVTANEQQPEPYFFKVLLDETEYNFTKGNITFKNKKRLSIEFASLDFTSTPANYSYLLEGIDEDWIAGNETRVVYLNLPPGNYTFKLKARKSMGNFSEEISLPITVKPTLFQRKSIQLLIILIILSAGILIIRSVYMGKIKRKETESTLITLEHKALQSMMNPHFIFNALGSIQRFLLENKADEAGTYLSQFARLIRQNMNSLKNNYIRIEDEVSRLRNYLELEQFRMNYKYDFTIDVDEEIESDELKIPSMVVQPFVENAIWHGISPLPENGTINVKFKVNDSKSIIVIVEDNGVGINKEKISNSEQNLNMGVSLTEKRLKLIGEKYNVKSEIETGELNPGNQYPGTKIKLIIPLIT